MTSESNRTCFVIQEFDKGKFDFRYTETIEPSIQRCGIKPVRADRILGLNPIIEKIEENIRKADICLAEVSTNNPNVWLELGFALALNKPCVIVCDSEMRDRLPFDIQHRPVLFYRSNSKSGFEELESKIEVHIKNELNAERDIKPYIVSKASSDAQENLEPYELEIIGYCLSKWNGDISYVLMREIQQHLSTVGYRDLTAGLGIKKLVDTGFLDVKNMDVSGYNAFEPEFQNVYNLSGTGMEWAVKNKSRFNLTSQSSEADSTKKLDDELPF